jgi:hypothetical protein
VARHDILAASSDPTTVEHHFSSHVYRTKEKTSGDFNIAKEMHSSAYASEFPFRDRVPLINRLLSRHEHHPSPLPTTQPFLPMDVDSKLLSKSLDFS